MDGDSYLRQAYDAIFHGDFELALYWFQQAIEIEPGNASHYYRGSVTCARSGKLSLALAYAEKSVELNPNDASYRLNLRTVTAKMRIADARKLLPGSYSDSKKGVELLKEAVQLDPLSVEARLLLGIGYRMLRDYPKALEALKETLMLDPQQDEAKRLLQEVRAERRRHLKQQYSHYNSKRNR